MENHKIPWFQTTSQIKITIKPPFPHLCRFIAVQKGNLFPLPVKLSWKTLRGAPPCVMSFCFFGLVNDVEEWMATPPINGKINGDLIYLTGMQWAKIYRI